MRRRPSRRNLATSSPRRRIHWAFVPAAIVAGAGAWVRYGPWVTLIAITAGLGVAAGAEWRARRRLP